MAIGITCRGRMKSSQPLQPLALHGGNLEAWGNPVLRVGDNNNQDARLLIYPSHSRHPRRA